MIFTDTDGQKYICCHCPNKPCGECRERTALIPIEEKNGAIAIKE